MAYCLLDAARMRDTLEAAKMIAGSGQHACLYQGVSQEQLSNVAPYLFVAQAPAFVDWLFAKGWGDCWGVFALSKSDMATLYNHFRRFLLVKDEQGQSLYFRFYDPRVLRQFLPTCDARQLTDFFGPVRYFIAEDEDPDYSVSYWLEDGKLQSRRLSRPETEQSYAAYLKARR